MSNLVYRFERHATAFPEQAAVVFRDQVYTYRQTEEIIDRLANALTGLGVQPGDRVAVMLPNSPEFIFTTYATIKMGAVQVAINVMYKEQEVAHLLGNSEAKAVFTLPEYVPIVEAVARKVPTVAHVIVVGQKTAGLLCYEDLLTESSPRFALVDRDPDDLAVISYTSGTTGVPKGAMLTHDNYLFQMGSLADYFNLGSNDHTLASLPLFLQSVQLLGPLLAFHIGSTCCVIQRYNPHEYAQMIKDWGVTWLGACVPTIFYDLSQMSASEVDMRRVRFALTGGSPLHPSVRHQFEEKFGFRIWYSYGGTETTGPMLADPFDRERKFTSPGRLLPGRRIRIRDDDGHLLGPDAEGEICSSGPLVMKGYWNMPEETAQTLVDGEFRSGDVGYGDADGFFYIVDRKQDVINRGGFKVFPVEVEKVLTEDPRVAECAVVGVPDPRLGEVPKAFIVLKKGDTATEEEFINLCRQKLANYKVPKFVEFRESLPKNALLKILRRELKAEEIEKARTSAS